MASDYPMLVINPGQTFHITGAILDKTSNIFTHTHKNLFSGSVVTCDSYLANNNSPATAELVRECQGHPLTILKLTSSNPIRLLHYSSE